MDLAEYYEEVTKTAGLKVETEVSEEKIAAVVAVSEQFDNDGIIFDSDEEKIAAAVAIIDGFDAVSEGTNKEAGIKEKVVEYYNKTKGGAKKGYDAAKEHLQKHKHKYGYGATAAGAAGAGLYAGRKSK